MSISTKVKELFDSELTMSKEDETTLLVEIVDDLMHITKEEAIEALIIKEYDLSTLLIKYADSEDIVEAVVAKDLLDDVTHHLAVYGGTTFLGTNPQKLAYQLTYEDIGFGTELLDELLYYRKQGRI